MVMVLASVCLLVSLPPLVEALKKWNSSAFFEHLQPNILVVFLMI